MRQGALRDYREVEEAAPTVRGRVRETDQLNRRYGLMAGTGRNPASRPPAR